MFASLRIVPLVCIGLGAGLLVSPRLAYAQELPGSASVEFDGPFLHVNDEEELTRGNVETLTDYFNFAHCECSRADSTFSEGTFAWELYLKNRSQPIGLAGDIWVGADCNSENSDTRNNNCTLIDTVEDLDALVSRRDRREIPLFNLMQPVPGQTTCPSRAGEATTWVLVDTEENGTYGYSASKKISFDTQPPNLPTDVKAVPGEGAILMSWTNPTERPTDTKYYYFLCAAGGEPALEKPSHKIEIETAPALCGTGKGIDFVASEGSATTPAWIVSDNLRPFVCGRVSHTTSETRIENLRAGVEYTVAMVAVDEARNGIGLFVPTGIIPTSVIDFWEDLHDQGSDAEGGYCIAASTYGDDSSITRALRSFRDDTLAQSGLGRWLTRRYYDVSTQVAPWVNGWALRALAALVLAPLVVIALLWHALTLPGLLALGLVLALTWRWRRTLVARQGASLAQGDGTLGRRAVQAMVALLVIAGWASTSSAQTSLDPYWADEDAASAEDPYAVSWHAGIRLGPYTPAIDSQFGSESGPYEQMFGGYAVMPMLDVDYIFLETGLGQIGAGGSIGYMSKSADTYEMGSPAGPGRPRTNEENTFRLIPLAATAVFRLTVLDDKYRVPIIPYVRGGLAYYLWWAEAPDGGVSSVCREGGVTCDENKARGASMGLVGSIGLAVRAENIDFEAASAMREGGIQHAGFYAELQAAKVDDFGVGSKLSVGDITWFAGVDFEF